MLLFLKKRNQINPHNISKLEEQESTFDTGITEKFQRKRLLFYDGFRLLRGMCGYIWKMAWERYGWDCDPEWTLVFVQYRVSDLYLDCNGTACYSGRVSGQSMKRIIRFLMQQSGIAPDKVSDREAGTKRSGNTGRTRLLSKMRRRFFM